MKILFDGRTLVKGNATGIPGYARSVLRGLLARDARNEYVVFANAFRAGPLPLTPAERARVRAINWRAPNRALDLSFKFLRRPRPDFWTGADVVFNPHFNVFPVRPRTRRVVTFHDLSFLRHPEFFSRRERLWHWRQDPHRQAREATRLIAVSRVAKRDLVECYGIAPEKVSVVRLGVNPFFAEPVPAAELDAFRAAHGLDRPFILSAGTLEPRKNVEGTIRAFNIVKRKRSFAPLRLVIVGGRGWLYDTILKEAAASPWKDDIVFMGYVPDEALRNLYRLASVFAFPSFYEGFGFPPLEAQACGTPVVASSRGALAEVLGDSALVADPADPAAIAAQIESLLDNAALGALVAANGRRNAARFRWDATAEATLAVLEGRPVGDPE